MFFAGKGAFKASIFMDDFEKCQGWDPYDLLNSINKATFKKLLHPPQLKLR